MSNGAPAKTFFLPGLAGQLFAIHYPPRKRLAHRRGIILVPPFAEEMNKSRRMLALQAGLLAKQGFSVLMVDLYGTGDSSGNFEHARWEIWKDNLTAGISWLLQQGATHLSLLGLRLGALLAMDFAKQWHGQLERIVLWQPIISGEAMMTQFLRLRLAASMMDSTREKESTKSLRKILAGGESVEVAGYQLAPQMALTIDRLHIRPLACNRLPPIHWLELISDQGRQPLLASQRVVEDWKNRGVKVSISSVVGKPFWSSVEITVAPTLLDATTRIFEE